MQEVGFFHERRPRSARGAGSLPRFETSRRGDIAPRPEPSWEEALARVVEGEIVPRLLLAHCAPRPSEPLKTTVALSDLFDFVGLLLAPEMASALTYVDLRRRGLPPEAALLDLLAPAARLLGDLWESDRLDFDQEQACAVGADGTALDAASAVSTAQSLLERALFV